MIKYIKEYRFYIILFFFLLIPILSIDTSTRNPRNYKFFDKAIVSITSPIQTLITYSLDSIVYIYHNYFALFETKQTHSTIIEENKRLMTTIINLREMEEENKRLRALLNFNEEFELDTVVARVISKDISPEFRALRLNRGTNDGIELNMPVVTQEGVIGRVMRVSAKTADILTVLDILSGIDVIVKRSRARGIVEGLSDELCQLKYTLRTDDVQPGDLLITSGLGGIYPKGIPVGTVSNVFRKPYGITQTIEVSPSVRFNQIEEVLIIKNFKSTPVHLMDSVSQKAAFIENKKE
jgi:rod shape-determining protein MreC